MLRSQLSLYEEDFQQEKKLKEALLEEKNKLDTELLKQIEFNKQLQESNNANVKLGHTFEDRVSNFLNSFTVTLYLKIKMIVSCFLLSLER